TRAEEGNGVAHLIGRLVFRSKHLLDQILPGVVADRHQAADVLARVSEPIGIGAALEKAIHSPPVDGASGFDGEVAVVPSTSTVAVEPAAPGPSDVVVEKLDEVEERVVIPVRSGLLERPEVGSAELLLEEGGP